MHSDSVGNGEYRDGSAGEGVGYPTALDLPLGGPVGWYDKKGRLRGSEAPLEGRCGKKLRRTDPPRYCTNRLGPGKTACRFHGGKSLSGVAAGRWKNGKHSRYMPKGIIEAYKAAVSDPDLYSIRSDIALIAVLQEKMLRAVDAASPPPWKKVRGLISRITKQVEAGADPLPTLRKLGALAEDGKVKAAAQEKAWDKWEDLVRKKTAAIMAEHRRTLEANAVYTVEQVMAVVSALIAAAKEILMPVDPKLFRALNARVAQLLPARPGE
jgi:hypothetical protein